MSATGHSHDAAGDAMRSIEEHLAVVLDAAAPLESYPVPVSVALGRTLREPVTARVDIPVFDNSAMDGFAVLFDDVAHASADSPVTLTVVADLPAGTDLDPPLAPGQAARIMTGSPTPTAATAVVPFEDTRGGLADSLAQITVVRAPRATGAHIRRRGEDARRRRRAAPRRNDPRSPPGRGCGGGRRRRRGGHTSAARRGRSPPDPSSSRPARLCCADRSRSRTANC